MSATTPYSPQLEIEARFSSTRQRTLALCEPLSAEDMMVQSSPETSPAKWHLAHTVRTGRIPDRLNRAHP
jgi:hypothetical protein